MSIDEVGELQSYHLKRAAQERQLCQKAKCSAAAKAHRKMMRLHERMIVDLLRP